MGDACEIVKQGREGNLHLKFGRLDMYLYKFHLHWSITLLFSTAVAVTVTFGNSLHIGKMFPYVGYELQWIEKEAGMKKYVNSMEGVDWLVGLLWSLVERYMSVGEGKKNNPRAVEKSTCK